MELRLIDIVKAICIYKIVDTGCKVIMSLVDGTEVILDLSEKGGEAE